LFTLIIVLILSDKLNYITMFILMIVVFVLGYTAIALEHPLKVDKAAPALLIGVVTWAILILNGYDILNLGYRVDWLEIQGTIHNYSHFIKEELGHHLSEVSEILFFLLGAMTIVEVVDRHDGFSIITDKIKTTNKVKLLWLFSLLTFFMSATLDNLTTTIVMLALLRKIIADKETRWFFAAMIVLASNAGGAWSPIGDVTTIMLWIGEQITAGGVISDLIIPSFVTMVVPVIIMSFFMKGDVITPEKKIDHNSDMELVTKKEKNLLFFLGVGALLFVPVFKTVTHLPPYMGMLFGLGTMWVVTEIMHKDKSEAFRKKYSVIAILKHVEITTIFFFLGILLAVASLQVAGHLALMSGFLDKHLGNIYLIDLSIGVLSSIVDNVPLVAGSMGMYDIANPDAVVAGSYAAQFVQDGNFWNFLALAAGTGGSILIIGSAAGVAAMGIEKIDFIWYLKKISLLALIGYLSGAATYYFMFEIL